jgi:prolyl oligopeptidase
MAVSATTIFWTKSAKYPQTKKCSRYFGTQVNDPYRWMEDDRSDETASWVKAQNEVTYGYKPNSFQSGSKTD